LLQPSGLNWWQFIARDLAATSADAPRNPKRSILELDGLGREIWEGIDAQEYVDAIRDGTDLPATQGSVDRA